MVEDSSVQPILGLRAAKQMGLITVNTENIAAVSENVPLSISEITQRYPSLFDGKLGLIKDEVSLEIDNTVQPVQSPIRRVPHAMMNPLNAELECLKKAQSYRENHSTV